MILNKRIENRKNIELPIFFAKDFSDDSYHDAVLRNVSTNGMLFKSNQMFCHGEYFFLKIDGFSSGSAEFTPYDAYAAQVRWCEKMDNPYYSIGVKHVGRAKIVNQKILSPSFFHCDFCGKRYSNDMVETDEHLHLCLDCFVFVSKSPGKACKSLNRFMAGNVI